MINNEEIQELDKVWHKLVRILQRTGEILWKDSIGDISTIEISILNIIQMKPDVILKEIINMLGIPNSTLTNAIDRLEKKDLIERVISKRDRRSFGLSLTETGILMLEGHEQGEKILFTKILEMYDTTDQRRQLITQLEGLAEVLDKIDFIKE